VTRAPSDRSHLSIGEVLSLLQEEFPDVTISKIRFLESQGLLDPERTPSGYRKFYEGDIDRLRWILRQQKDHYLPLKVIKDRLDDIGPGQVPPEHNGAAAAATNGEVHGQGTLAVALDDRPRAPRRDDTTELLVGRGPDGQPPGDGAAVPPRREPAAAAPAAAAAAPSRSGGPLTPPAGAASLSLTADELAHASGLTAREVRELEQYQLVVGHVVGDTSYYDADALVIARAAAGFLQHGIEPRHIRAYKVAAEREANLFDQIVSPLLKQRNPDARRRATQTVVELARLGEEMRNVMLRRALRDHLPPG
jgi:DNA-binding transcriptional MerR regulator